MMKSTTSKISYSISDSRWFEAMVEPYNFISVTEAVEPMESCFEKHESGSFSCRFPINLV